MIYEKLPRVFGDCCKPMGSTNKKAFPRAFSFILHKVHSPSFLHTFVILTFTYILISHYNASLPSTLTLPVYVLRIQGEWYLVQNGHIASSHKNMYYQAGLLF